MKVRRIFHRLVFFRALRCLSGIRFSWTFHCTTIRGVVALYPLATPLMPNGVYPGENVLTCPRRNDNANRISKMDWEHEFGPGFFLAGGTMEKRPSKFFLTSRRGGVIGTAIPSYALEGLILTRRGEGMKYGLAFVLALAVSGCATTTKEAQIETALGLTKEHFKNTATVKDDSLDTVATITTVNGIQEKRGLLGIVRDDNFLRAVIDKKTGKTSFQLYQVIYYQGSGWNLFQTVNFETPYGPQSKPVTVISRNVDCAGSRYGGCTYVEHIAFDVDESLLRTIAGNYSPGQRPVWRFKFTAKSGIDSNEGMLPAEIAGLLEKVDEYLQGKSFARGAAVFQIISRGKPY
jgi:hypothetical protein